MTGSEVGPVKMSEVEVSEGVGQLKKLTEGDDQLQHLQPTDTYLLRYLYCTDFDVDSAFKKIKEYYNVLLDSPEWFETEYPSEKRQKIEVRNKLMLPNRNTDGSRVFIYQLGKVDPSQTSLCEQARLDDIWYELVLNEKETLSSGLNLIIDMKGGSWKMVQLFAPNSLKISSRKTDAFPLKTVVYHVVNTSFLANATLKSILPFMSSKFKEKIKFHFDWSSLHKSISPKILPKEYGGTGPELNYEESYKWLFENDSMIGDNLNRQHRLVYERYLEHKNKK